MGVHGIMDDMKQLQNGELPQEELRALEADLTGKVRRHRSFLMAESLNLTATLNFALVYWYPRSLPDFWMAGRLVDYFLLDCMMDDIRYPTATDIGIDEHWR